MWIISQKFEKEVHGLNFDECQVFSMNVTEMNSNHEEFQIFDYVLIFLRLRIFFFFSPKCKFLNEVNAVVKHSNGKWVKLHPPKCSSSRELGSGGTS